MKTIVFAEWTFEQSMMFWGFIFTSLTALVGAIFAGYASARSGRAEKSSVENTKRIATTNRITDDVMGHIKSVEKAVNGLNAKNLEAAKIAATAKGALDQRTQDEALAVAHEAGRRAGEDARANEVPVEVEVVNEEEDPVHVMQRQKTK